MAHGCRVVCRCHVTGSVDPVHGKVAACLLITLQYTIHSDASAWCVQILLPLSPVQLVDPVDGARSGAYKI